MLNKKKNNKGFTLVELLVVIAIIGILAVVAVPALFKNINKAKVADLEADYNAIKSAVLSYYSDNNELPGDVTGSLANYMDNVPNKSALGEGTYNLEEKHLTSDISDTTSRSLFLVVGEKPLKEHVKEKPGSDEILNHSGTDHTVNCYVASSTAEGITLTEDQINKLKNDMGDNMVFIGDSEATASHAGKNKVLRLKLIDNTSSAKTTQGERK